MASNEPMSWSLLLALQKKLKFPLKMFVICLTDDILLIISDDDYDDDDDDDVDDDDDDDDDDLIDDDDDDDEYKEYNEWWTHMNDFRHFYRFWEQVAITVLVVISKQVFGNHNTNNYFIKEIVSNCYY